MAGARESLSPLIRSTRRLSLELCGQLLSPLRISPLSNEPRALITGSPNPKSPALSFFQNNQFLSALSPNNNATRRRGSLGCITPKRALDFTDAVVNDENKSNLIQGDVWGAPKNNEYRRGSWCVGSGVGEDTTNSFNSTSRWINSVLPVPSIKVEQDVPNQNDDEDKEISSSKEEPVHTMGEGLDLDLNNNNIQEPLAVVAEHWHPQPRGDFSDKEKNLYSTPVLDKIKILNKRLRKFANEEEEYKYIWRKHELQITLGETLGRGSFGTVLPGFYKGKAVAAKILPIRTTNQLDSFQNEKNALELPWHPNVVEVLQVLEISPMKGIVILEKLEKGNLLSKLNACETGFPMEFYYRSAVEIASALYHCHCNGILHLDVKPQNILLGQYNECKLTDFGSSKRVGDLYLKSNYSKLDGTVAYKAPELFCGVRPTDKCDVYSFGITLWQIITHQMPYTGENEHSIIFKVVAKGFRPKTKLSEDSTESIVETKFKELIGQCWDQNPLHRPSMQSVTEYLSNMKI